jgi:hypothetical protein
MKRRYATVAVVAGLALGAFATGIAVAGDNDSPQGCNPGEWVHAKVVKANGESLSMSDHADLPAG